jgi:hypothetical protein
MAAMQCAGLLLSGSAAEAFAHATRAKAAAMIANIERISTSHRSVLAMIDAR